MKTHPTLKRLGVGALAVATVAAGLSFGSAAASAAPTTSASTSADISANTVQLIWQNGNGRFYTPVHEELWPGHTGYWLSANYATLAEAKRNAITFPVNRYSDGWYSLVAPKKPSNCVSIGFGSSALFVPGETTTGVYRCGEDLSKFKVINGTLVSKSQNAPVSRIADRDILHSELVFARGTGLPLRGDLSAIGYESFTAGVVRSDTSGRSADLAGRGQPGAKIRVGGAEVATVQGNATWTATVTGLALGTNRLALEHWEGNTKTAQTTVNADLVVTQVTAAAVFRTAPSLPLQISGTAQAGAEIEVLDADGVIVETGEADVVTGRFTIDMPAPHAGGDQHYTVQQRLDGELDTRTAPVVAEFGAPVAITSPVDDQVHDGGPLTFSGAGVPKGTVALREQGKQGVIGAATVLDDGTWTMRDLNISDRKLTYVATQTGKGNNVTTSTVQLNPDADTIDTLTVETPAAGSTVTTSRPTFTGHGHDGAIVTIGYGPDSIIGTAVVENAEWTIDPTRGLGMGVSNLVVTQTMGDDVQTVTHTLTRVAVEQPLRVTSHVDGQTYAEGTTTFRGTAPVGSAIRATNQWGTVMGTATATDGSWSFTRNLGPTTAGYDLTFVATPPVGDPQTVSLKLHYQGALAFEVTSPVNDSTYAVGTTTFTGTATPNTAVTATNQWGTPMGSANTRLGTSWAFDRYLGPTSAGYDITFVATKGLDTQRSTLHLNTAVVNAPVVVTSIADGATYRPGLNVLTGTGTPGATVEAVNATNGWNVPMGRATVKADGTWALPERNWGPSNDYAIQVTQTNPDKTTSTTTVTVKAPVFAPLVLTSPAVGDTYDTGVAALFEGTATPFAAITVRSAQSSTIYRTVHADADGNWSFTRVWGPTHDYVLNIEQKAKNGQADAITGFAWEHSGN